MPRTKERSIDPKAYDECLRSNSLLLAENKRLRAERDRLAQYITDFGSPADWNRIRRLYPELPDA